MARNITRQNLSERCREFADRLIAHWDRWEQEAGEEGTRYQSTLIEGIHFQAAVSGFIEEIYRNAVMDSAHICDGRASVEERNFAIRQEASKCGMQIRHELLCGEGETMCLVCDGERCERCDFSGFTTKREEQPNAK